MVDRSIEKRASSPARSSERAPRLSRGTGRGSPPASQPDPWEAAQWGCFWPDPARPRHRGEMKWLPRDIPAGSRCAPSCSDPARAPLPSSLPGSDRNTFRLSPHVTTQKPQPVHVSAPVTGPHVPFARSMPCHFAKNSSAVFLLSAGLADSDDVIGELLQPCLKLFLHRLQDLVLGQCPLRELPRRLGERYCRLRGNPPACRASRGTIARVRYDALVLGLCPGEVAASAAQQSQPTTGALRFVDRRMPGEVRPVDPMPLIPCHCGQLHSEARAPSPCR